MDLKDQKFGIEIELTGISRRRAAEVAAAHFGTSSYYVGTYYDTYAAKDQQQREWKFMSDASIKAQGKEGKTRFDASPEYRTEMVSPICRYEDIVTVQELIRKLREAGAFANKSCGIHVHIDASPFDARTLRNITNIMAAKEDLIYKALQVSVARQHRWCQPVEQRFLDDLNSRKPKSMEAVERIWYLPQMEKRCPGATVVGTGEVKGYELLFRGVATIEPRENASVPVLLWKISPRNEKALDRYEGWPHLYRKENLEVEIEGKGVSAMVYVMNDGRQASMPSGYYYDVIAEGYRTAGMDEHVLEQALERTKEVMEQEQGARMEESFWQHNLFDGM